MLQRSLLWTLIYQKQFHQSLVNFQSVKIFPKKLRIYFWFQNFEKRMETSSEFRNLLRTLIFWGFVGAAFCDEFPTVKVSEGELKGVYLKSRAGKTYSAFMGIPYANKPEKFELAEPASKWEGLKDATKFGSVCPQFNILTQKYEGREECLFVNVFTPDVKTDSKKRAVLVFIHGGGFYFGNSNENGADFLMDEDVTFVTFNYRLNSLGFLSMGDEVLPGNLGLKDQVLLLQWVEKNIGFFNGDKDRVTLAGESAGAASVSYHIISPASKGLFRNAICQSGSALNKWAYIQDPKKASLKLAEKLGCPKESVELKKCLKSKSAKEIVQKSLVDASLLTNIVVYGPTIEVPSPNAFLTEHPEILYQSGKFQKVPLIMSVNEKEGLLINAASILKNEKIVEKINNDFLKAAPEMFLYDDPSIPQEAKDVISKRIKKFYFQDKPISNDTMKGLTDAYSDSYFIYGVRNTVIQHAKHAPVYVTVLAYPDLTWSQIMNLGYDKPMGVTHADDLRFLFTDVKYPKIEPESKEEMLSKLLVKGYASMAINGNPNVDKEKFGAWEPVGKEEIESGQLRWLYVRNFPKLETEPLGKRMEFWDKINKKLAAQQKKEEL